jgi:hypothetical protein
VASISASTPASDSSDEVSAAVLPDAGFAGLQVPANATSQAKSIAFTTMANVTDMTSDAGLLLLDQAVADFGNGSDGEHDDLATIVADSQSDVRHELSDLALTAVFDNETDWRNAI